MASVRSVDVLVQPNYYTDTQAKIVRLCRTKRTAKKRRVRQQFSLILSASRPLVWWSVLIGGATILGYPGIITITPLAWPILPFFSGIYYTETAIAKRMRPKLRYALLLGLWIGTILSLLYAIVTQFFLDIPPYEVEETVDFLRLIVKAGCLSCPLFSVLSTYFQREWIFAN
jgi:hypothetical protein